ncbi:MAG TPA: hypothetical protein VIK55_11380 [Paludibacter sp.]
MKKISIIALFCLIIGGCVREYSVSYYQLRNESGQDISIKLYISANVPFSKIDTIFIEKGKSSTEFRETSGSIVETMYIWTSDSADIYLNGVFKKRYRYSTGYSVKTFYSSDYYASEIKNSKDQMVHVYTFLAEDFK